ncbi:hypothetical protein MMPV_002990 [Pyropia vietnamensis]
MAPAEPISLTGGTLAAVLFDMDGTLVAVDHLHYEAYADTLQAMEPAWNGGERITRDFYAARMSGRQNQLLLADILPHVSPDRAAEIASAKEAAYMDRTASGIPPMRGVNDLIKTLTVAGVPVGVVTNAPRHAAAHTLTAAGLADCFSFVVTADDVARPKPDPAPYVAGCAAVGVEPGQAIAFEDSPSGIASAVAAGLLTIGIATGHAPAVLKAAGAALIIDDYTDAALVEAMRGWMAGHLRRSVVAADGGGGRTRAVGNRGAPPTTGGSRL